MQHKCKVVKAILSDEFINFKFEIEPEDIMTSESYSAFFNCKFNIGAQLFPKYYHTRIEWLKDGTLLFQNEDIKRRTYAIAIRIYIY